MRYKQNLVRLSTSCEVKALYLNRRPYTETGISASPTFKTALEKDGKGGAVIVS